MTRVRPATPADLDALTRLFVGYQTFYGRPGDPAAARDFLAARQRDGDSVVLVAEAEGALVGFTQVYPTWSSLSMARVWVLNDLFVDPATRGTGAGRALVRAVLAAARAAGAVRISLSTQTTNTTAQALYVAEGFERDDEFWTYTTDV
ncbi:GCN5-related N-acetyltransferase [Cellulomonas flavigena DSM 20109]|uniref:GCN5-related N-acetyltransferase n=1 Tax=Cellulomonas flavigena (strain ATCC 482 / DSM 20109 / BCRC 11376 / JCM 18109 / NBRC 3775 / NCIMB 8073 / NRS 134) TaxID=446466 RepID=D5UK99_CELFN|nr:GNAT family N-acetyltransferase [Cellulomonas flavigena]ADG75760.1 GCN5-related N-acetyltransferase [Cellulomonas flavigena DSM 20109]